jgi:hypothetical protein
MSKARGLADLGNVYDDGALSNRNLIINGAATGGSAVTIFPEGTGFSLAFSSTGPSEEWVGNYKADAEL